MAFGSHFETSKSISYTYYSCVLFTRLGIFLKHYSPWIFSSKAYILSLWHKKLDYVMHTLTVYCTIKNMLFDFFISGSNAYFHFRIREVSFRINNLHISLWKKVTNTSYYVWIYAVYDNQIIILEFLLFDFTQLKTKYRFMLLPIYITENIQCTLQQLLLKM